MKQLKQVFHTPYSDAERILFLGIGHFLCREYKNAIAALLKSINLKLDKTSAQVALTYLGIAYTNTDEIKKAVNPDYSY